MSMSSSGAFYVHLDALTAEYALLEGETIDQVHRPGPKCAKILKFDRFLDFCWVRDSSKKVPLTRLAPDWPIFVRFRRFFVRFVTFSIFLYFFG